MSIIDTSRSEVGTKSETKLDDDHEQTGEQIPMGLSAIRSTAPILSEGPSAIRVTWRWSPRRRSSCWYDRSMQTMDRIIGTNRTTKHYHNAHGASTGTGPTPVLSVIVPVYGCQSCIRRLHERLTATLHGLDTSHEVIFVDDRAEDGSWSEIERLADLDSSVRYMLYSDEGYRRGEAGYATQRSPG
jgi:Glycosyl transferase family 2